MSSAGELLEDQGKFDSSIAFYERCCAITRGGRFGIAVESEALSNLGYALKRCGRYVEALGHYDASLAVHETEVTLANRAKLLIEMRHWVGSGEEHTFDETPSGVHHVPDRRALRAARTGDGNTMWEYRATCDRFREWSLAYGKRLHVRTPVRGAVAAAVATAAMVKARAAAAGASKAAYEEARAAAVAVSFAEDLAAEAVAEAAAVAEDKAAAKAAAALLEKKKPRRKRGRSNASEFRI